METNETIEEDDTKTTMKIHTELLDDSKHLATDMKSPYRRTDEALS